MKQKFTRFAVLPDERRVMLGIDLGELFEAGYVYHAFGFDGEVIFKKMGKFALAKDTYPGLHSTVNEQVQGGLHLATEEEYEAICKTDNS